MDRLKQTAYSLEKTLMLGKTEDRRRRGRQRMRWLDGITNSMAKVSFVCIYVTVWASQVLLVVKNPLANAGDVRDAGSIPGLGRSPR